MFLFTFIKLYFKMNLTRMLTYVYMTILIIDPFVCIHDNLIVILETMVYVRIQQTETACNVEVSTILKLKIPLVRNMFVKFETLCFIFRP